MTYTYKEQADYNIADTSTKLLEKLIPSYHQPLQASMVKECNSIINIVREFEPKTESKGHGVRIKPWTIQYGHKMPAYFTVNFTMPVIRYISPAFEPIHKRLTFIKHHKAEYVPCYIMNINHVVLIKTSQDSDVTSYRINKGMFHRYVFIAGGKPMTFSSTNTFLFGSAEEKTQTMMQDVIERCFEVCYWNLPTPKNIEDKSCIHNLIYRKNDSIITGGVIRLYKTLVKIIRIKNKKSYDILQMNPIKCRAVDVSLLVYDGKRIFCELRSLFITENVLGSLEEGHIINAIMITQNIKHPTSSLVIGKTGDVIKIGNVMTLLGIILWRNLQHLTENSSITRAGCTKMIMDQILEILHKNSDKSDIFYPDIAWDTKIHNNVKRSISNLFPLYVVEGDIVHQLSPTMMSFLLAFAPKLLSNKEFIGILVRLLDLLEINSSKWDKESHLILNNTRSDVSASLDSIFSSLPEIVSKMTYSRIFSRHSDFVRLAKTQLK